MKKISINNTLLMIITIFCALMVSTVSVFALSNSHLSANVSAKNTISYAFALSISVNNSSYTYFYDNSQQNTVSTTNLVISAEPNNCIKISALKSYFTNNNAYFKLTNYYQSNTTLRLKVYSATAYNRPVDVSGITFVSATYDNTSSALTFPIPSTAESDDLIEIYLQIYIS